MSDMMPMAMLLTLTLNQKPGIRSPSDPPSIYVLDNVCRKPMMIASGDVFGWMTIPLCGARRCAELNDDVCLNRITSGIEKHTQPSRQRRPFNRAS